MPHLHEDGGAQVLVSVPPVAGAAGTAAGAEDALIQPVLRGERGGQSLSLLIEPVLRGEKGDQEPITQETSVT